MNIINNNFIFEIKNIIESSRASAVSKVNHERTLMYWHIGEKIVEEEQGGKERAEYGKFIIKQLSEQLQPEFGSGFSIRQLERYRKFYNAFPITSALRTQLNWTQYRTLISIDDEDKREYYIAESVKNNWTSRELDRQVSTNFISLARMY